MLITKAALESGRIRHTGWTLGRDTAENCGVNVDDYFGARGEYLGADENGLEPTFEEVVEYGDLHDYATGEYLRPATLPERDESRASGPEGVILVRGRRCYVQE